MDINKAVLFPVQNEQNYLQEFCLRLEHYWDQDVVFFDDGFTDTSSVILQEFVNRYKKVDAAVIEHPRRQGYGAALTAGFNYSLKRNYQHIVAIDSNLQHKPEDIESVASDLEGSEVMLASRYLSFLSLQCVPYFRLSINRYISCKIARSYGVKFTNPF